MTHTVLLTGFEPFGGEPVNPSEQLVGRFAGTALHPDIALHAAVLPVDIRRVRESLHEALARTRPDVVLACGQAAGRMGLHLEGRAFNVLDFRGEADNGGHRARGEPLHPHGPEWLDATLPVHELAARVRAAGHAAHVSLDAGRHLCNAVLYELLAVHPECRAAFVHVPLLPEQSQRRARSEPAQSLDDTWQAMTALLAALPSVLDG